MEPLYAEANAKQMVTARVILLKTLLIFGVVVIALIGLLTQMTLLILLDIAAVVALIWYWPRFHVEWEYVFCDGQIDFDQILGGEKRKTILRIQLEDADLIAPMDSHRMDAYRHLQARDYSSLRPEAKKYGIATRLEGKEEKVVLVFEPNEKMLSMISTKYPGKTELAIAEQS
jgi:hypothetical protein